MKVMIMSCNGDKWYKKKISDRYMVVGQDKYKYKVKVGKETKNISKGDVAVIER